MRRDLTRGIVLRTLLAVLFVFVGAFGGVSVAFGQEEPAAAPAAAADPADQIVVHIEAMTRLVKDNRDEPEKVKSELKAYLGQNGAAMKASSDAFESRLNGLPADEAEAYKEKLQRKMEKALAAFLEAMLDFAERHPDAAKELDELLQKVE